MKIIQFSAKVILIIFFNTDVVRKIKKKIDYYFAIKANMKISSEKIARRVAALMFACNVLILELLFISLIYQSNWLCGLIGIYGIFLELIYLFFIFRNFNETISDNCNCFSSTLPQRPSVKSIFLSLGIIYLFILLML